MTDTTCSAGPVRFDRSRCDMDSPQETRYRLVGRRKDGSRTIILRSMTADEARRAQSALVVARIFDSINVVVDSGDDTLISD